MALITCPDCGKQFSDTAAACPHCGRPPTVPLGRRKVGCGGCLVLAVVGLLVLMIIGKSSTPSTEPLVSPSAAKEAVRKLLKDPESARFSDEYVKTKGNISAFCGRVSAKNGFGGYGEPELFVVIGPVAVINTRDNPRGFVTLWDSMCTNKPTTRQSSSRAAATQRPVRPKPQAPPKEFTFIGDTMDRHYIPADCEIASKIPPDSRIYFKSEADAIAGHFTKLARGCN